MTRTEKLNMLFGEDYELIDLFPRPEGEGCADFFAQAEQFFLQDRQLSQFCDRTVTLVLKLLCYYPFEMYVQEYAPLRSQRSGWLKDKRCETVAKILRKVIMRKKGQVDILLGKENTIISIVGGTLSIAVYHPSDSVSCLLERLTEAEGLYRRRYYV